jgi:threonine dehydrogenase-like Zn-dependent dehydrogenase
LAWLRWRQVRFEARASEWRWLGLGVIGLCTCAMARRWGREVVAVANSEFRAQKALEAGAHRADKQPKESMCDSHR